MTGHFDERHFHGPKGPRVPILMTDPRSSGATGFDERVSVTNFPDENPLMSRRGEITELSGDSSEVGERGVGLYRETTLRGQGAVP